MVVIREALVTRGAAWRKVSRLRSLMEMRRRPGNEPGVLQCLKAEWNKIHPQRRLRRNSKRGAAAFCVSEAEREECLKDGVVTGPKSRPGAQIAEA